MQHMAENETSKHRQNAGTWLIAPQHKLGTGGLLALIVITDVLVPFSIDMYTPALPALPSYFNTTAAVVNLTIIGFFFFMTIGMLVFGPVSDRFGRKPVLLGGMVCYVAGSVLCVFSRTIGTLIAARIIQAIGAGAVSAVCMALVKDCFVADRREQVLAIIQVLTVIGPVIAPLFGGVILSFFSWHYVFAALALFGTLCLILSLLFEETLPEDERVEGGVISTMAGLVHVGKNPAFMVLLLVPALFNTAFMGYVAVASYIYEDFFGTTPQVYTYFFAATAAIGTLGPIIWVKVSKRTTPRMFTHIVIIACIAVGIVMLLFAEQSVFTFFLCMALFATASAASRPYITNILLAQQENDTGAASALINFVISICGVIGMALAVLPWSTYVAGLSIVLTASSVLAGALWIALLRIPRLHIRELDKNPRQAASQAIE